MRIPSRSATIALIAVVLATVTASSAVAAGDHQSTADPTGRDDPTRPITAPDRLASSSEDALAYWTVERMTRAKPMDYERDRRKPRADDSSVLRRKGRTVAGVDMPNDQQGRVVKAAQNQPASTYPYPFGRRSVERQLRTTKPYRTVGRIFFRQNGANYACSGASVVSGPRQVVFTAGHCLNDGQGHWSKDVVFIPGRRPGKLKSPYGTFAAKQIWVPEGWALDGLDPYDMGAFSVGKNARRKSLQKAVGALGFGYNLGRVQHWDVFGYPAQAPFTGDRLVTCASAFAVEDTVTEGPNTTGIGCDMTGGSSGGPWILLLRRGNLLNGVTTYGYQAQPAAIYGPYFDTTANHLRCAAATGDTNASTC